MSERKEIKEEADAEKVYQSSKGKEEVKSSVKEEPKKKEKPVNYDAAMATAKANATSFITCVGSDEDMKTQVKKLKDALEVIDWDK
jgi:hypothetical protein